MKGEIDTAELKAIEYIIEFEPTVLMGDNQELCLKSKSVQKLVRCRNCEHTTLQPEDDGGYCIYCRVWDRWEMPPNGFCHYGQERK